MSEKSKEFFKKNLSWFHIVGIVLGCGLSILYWYKQGQFTENVLKNNIFLISIWGIVLGYITFDLIKSALNKKNQQ